jgi:hypothetical protein
MGAGVAAKRKVRRPRIVDDDDDDDLPPPPGVVSEDRMPWERTDRFAKEVDEIHKQFAHDRRKRFPGVDTITASEAMRVARLYGKRPEIYRRLSWIALFELSSPKMAQSVRRALEAKILAGQSVTASQIRKARGRLKGGCMKRKIEPATRLAA